MELHNVSYGIEYVARPLLSRSRLDTAYWGFLGVGTTFDIFQNIILIPYLEYGVLSPLDTAYWSSEQTKAIRNFGKECNEPLHLAWEWFNDLLYNCPEHKINEHEKLQIFYQGLDPETRKKADFKGPIPRKTPAARIKAIDKLSKHSLSWYKEQEYKKNDFDKVLKHINDFEHNISVLNEEVRMVQHLYKTPNDKKDSLLKETISSFIKEAYWMQKKSENFVWRIKMNYDRTFKNQASAIKTIEKNLEKITPEQTHNSTKKTDPPIPFPRRLKKENEKEQFQKFLGDLQQLHINIPFIETLEQMPKYAKFMKDLLSKKRKGSEVSQIILNEQCSAVILNKVSPKEKDPGGFTIPCIIGQSGITKALTNLGASISLMLYSMFLRLNLGDLKPTRMCIELPNKTTQFPKEIAENVVVKIDKFVFPVDFAILDMEEDHRIPIILERPFLATSHAMIDVFNKKISFEVWDEIITIDLEKSIRFPSSDEDTCHSADIIDLFVVDNIKEILPQNHDNSIEPILDRLPAIHEDCNNLLSSLQILSTKKNLPQNSKNSLPT
ncbi:transposon ty3-I gag-pol polyprotein [Tanacetum coccineum]